MTRLELDTYIDTNITDKTEVNSITPVDEGNALKEVADYVDQEVATKQDELESGANIKTINGDSLLGTGDLVISGTSFLKKVKVTLSSAQLLDLFTTPIELVPAVTGKVIIPQFLHQRYTHVSTAYTTSGLFKVGLGSINFAGITFSATVTSADNAQGLTNLNYNQSISGLVYENLPIVVGATTANPVGGDGTLDIYLTYLEITI
jgi:hypothetical protein